MEQPSWSINRPPKGQTIPGEGFADPIETKGEKVKTNFSSNSINEMKNIFPIIAIFVGLSGFISCNKYLDKKPDKRLSTATTIDDCEALLDDAQLLNSNFPNELEISADNYYIPGEYLAFMPEYTRNYYQWKGTELNPATWLQLYKIVSYANLVIEGLSNFKPNSSEITRYNNVLGNAYFYRGFTFYQISQLYAPTFGENDPSNSLGIPLRLSSDVNILSKRSSITETYQQIVSDLRRASELLSEDNLFKTRANKSASLAALSRVFLIEKNYDSVSFYASKSLTFHNDILDFNTLNSSSKTPIYRFNKEVLYHTQGQNDVILQPYIGLIDTALLKEYEIDDLRREVFFRSNGDGTFSFKCGYEGVGSGRAIVFGGLTTGEVCLNLSESLARRGLVDSAMNVLNKLLNYRYKTGTFTNRVASNKDDAIRIILSERRKELVFRGLRWIDLRRFKNEPSTVVIPKRKIGTDLILLLPDSKRYTLLLPAQAVSLGGLPQNP